MTWFKWSHFPGLSNSHFFSNSDLEILIPVVTFLSLAFIISFQHFFFSFSNSTTIPNNLPFFFLERTCQISMYSNLPTLKIHIHKYSIKPAKYQCKILIHIYRYILSNINVFNLPTLMIHIHARIYIYIEPANFFFFFEKEPVNYQFIQTC